MNLSFEDNEYTYTLLYKYEDENRFQHFFFVNIFRNSNNVVLKTDSFHGLTKR